MSLITRLSEKYQSFSAPVKASFWFLMCSLFQSFLSLITTPFFTRAMSQDEYGVFVQYSSWLAIMNILVTLNLSSETFIKQLTENEDNEKTLLSSMLGLNISLFLGYFFLYLLFPTSVAGLLNLTPALLRMLLLQLFVVPSFEYWKNKERCHFRYRLSSVISIGISVIGYALSIWGVLNLSNKVEARVGGELLIKTIIGVIFIFIIFKDGKKFFDREIWKFSLKYSLPLIPHYLSNIVLNQSDRLMIGRMVGDSAAAKYGIAYMISSMVWLVVSATNSSFIPYSFRKLKDHKENEIRKNANKLLIMIALLCLLATALAPEIIRFFAASNYSDTVYVVPPIAAAEFFIFVFTLFSDVEYFYKKTKWIGIATGIAAILNIILNYCFIPRFSYYAAGYTTLVSYIILSLLHYIAYRRICKENNITDVYDIRAILQLSLAVLLMTGLFIFTLDIAWVRYSIAIISLVIAFVVYKKGEINLSD